MGKKIPVDKKEKKDKLKKEVVGVAAFVRCVLAENIKRKLTDVQLAEKITKAFPDRAERDVAYVKKHRSIFNNGRFPEQNGRTPKVRLEQFGADVKTTLKNGKLKRKVIKLKRKK